jgi:hypothetical protein
MLTNTMLRIFPGPMFTDLSRVCVVGATLAPLGIHLLIQIPVSIAISDYYFFLFWEILESYVF